MSPEAISMTLPSVNFLRLSISSILSGGLVLEVRPAGPRLPSVSLLVVFHSVIVPCRLLFKRFCH